MNFKEFLQLEQSPFSDSDIAEFVASEIEKSFTTSGGPGGQNVNKVATQAQVWWPIETSIVWDLAEKEDRENAKIRFVKLAGKKQIKKDKKTGAILAFFKCSKTRNQRQNLNDCIQRIVDIVKIALQPPVLRIPTEPTRGSKERSREDREQHSQRKKERRWRYTG